MELENKTFFERFIGFKYGLIAASISSIWMVYLFATKSVISPVARLSLLLIPLCLFVGIFFSIRNFRNSNVEGKMSFSLGFKSGLQTVVAYSLIMAIATFICQAIIYPEFSIDVIANAKARGIEEHVDVIKMNDILNKMKQDVAVGSQVTKTVFGGLLTGTICALLCAGLMRKE